MGLNIHLTNKTGYTLLIIFLFLLIGIGVYAYTQSIPDPGHSADQVWVSINNEELTLQQALDQGKVSGGSVSCDWEGWDSRRPWEGGSFCTQGKLLSYTHNPATKDLWVEQGGCATEHKKGYHCSITIQERGSYDLKCWKTGEDHGEWVGEEKGLRNEVSHANSQTTSNDANPSVQVLYNVELGAWGLQSKGKENNQGNPSWSTKGCGAGGYK